MNLLAYILPAVILVLTLSGGGIYTWTLCLAAVFLSIIQTVYALRFSGGNEDAPSSLVHTGIRRFLPPNIHHLYFLILCLMIACVVPIPARFSSLAGSPRAEQNDCVIEALQRANAQQIQITHSQALSFSFTRNRAGTLRILVMTIAFLAVATLSSRVPPARKPFMFRLLLVIGALIALSALISAWFIPQEQTLLWTIPIPSSPKEPLACFVNRNHLGGFLAMLSPIALVSLLQRNENRGLIESAVFAVTFVLFSLGVLVSLSRGALIAYGAGILAMALFYLLQRRRKVALLLLFALFAGTILLPRVPAAPLRERMETLHSPMETHSLRTRCGAWIDSLRIWQQYPLLGAGPNAFRMVYPQYRTASHSSHMTHPENEYFQLLAETGILGFLIFFALAASVLHKVRKGRPNRQSDCELMPGIIGATTVVAVHAAVDFPLHVPLYSLTFACIIGSLLTPPFSSLEPATPRRTIRLSHLFLPGLYALVALSILAVSPSAQRLDSPEYLQQASAPEIARALVWAPTSPHAWYYMGRSACALNTTSSCIFGETCLTRATIYDPMNYRLWYQLGMLRMKLGQATAAQEAFSRARNLRAWLKVPYPAKE